MPRSLGFKPCTSCRKPMPRSDPHQNCLKCLGETRVREKCKICNSFCPRTKKDCDIQLKAILMELALRLASEPGCSDSVMGTAALARSSPPALFSFWYRSPSPVPKKSPKKTHAEQECLMAGKKSAGDQVRPVLGHQSPQHLQVSLPLRASSSVQGPTLGSRKGPHHLAMPTTLEAFQVMKELLAMLIPLMPREGRLLHQDSVPTPGSQH